jgi:hypothetical protein
MLVFEKQGQHLLMIALLLAGVAWATRIPGVLEGSHRGIPTSEWFWWSIAVPIVHQTWVWLCWRLELHHKALSSSLGDWGFRIYAIGFATASLFRFYTIVGLGLANRGSLDISQTLLNVLALVMSIPTIYLFYSVGRYFSYQRALGADHFDESYRTRPLECRGIFRFTRNGMYIYGFFSIWIPGLLFASKAALLSAAFSHIYIWVHYYCTEKPDMSRIYGQPD